VAAIEAVMKGAPTQFVLDARVRADALEVGSERGVGVDADARLTPNGIAVSRSTITPRTGGEIHATLDVPFGADTAWWIDSTWRGLDAASAFRLAEVRVLPFGAALEGTARFDRGRGEPWRLEVHNHSTARRADGTAPLDGDVEFFVAGDRWRANQRHRMGATLVEGRIGGVWNRQAASRSTFEGTVTLDTANIGEAAGYAALFGLPAPSIVRGTSGPLQATAAMSGIFTAPRFVGTATSDRAVVPSVGIAALAAGFDVSPNRVEVTDIVGSIRPDAETPSASAADVRGAVAADLVSRALSGGVTVTAASAADLFPAIPAALQLQGPLNATATFAGTVDRPAVAADVASQGLSIAGQAVDALTAKAHLDGTAVVVDTMTLRQGDGELHGNGRYDWTARTYAIDLDGQRLTWRGALPRRTFGGEAGAAIDVTAQLGLKFAGSGSIDRPIGEGAIDFVVAGGPAGELIDRGILNLRLTGSDALVTGRVPSLGAFVTMHVQPRQPFDYDGVIVMNRINLDPVIALAGLQAGFVTGTASLSARATGTLSNAAESTVFVNLQDVDAAVSNVPLRLAAPSRLAWERRGLTIDTLDLAVGRGRLLASGRLGEGGLENASWQSSFTGELGEVLMIGRPLGVPPELVASGPVQATWRSSGGLDRSTATIGIENGSVTWEKYPPLRNLSLAAAFNGTTLDVTRLTGEWQDGTVEGSASLPRELLRNPGAANAAPAAGFARLRVTGVSENAFEPWLSAAALTAIDGRLSAALDLRITQASLEGLSGSLTLDEAEFTMAGVRIAEPRPALLEIANGVVTARDVTLDVGGSPLALTGTVRIAPQDKRALDLAVRGTADLRLISAFAPAVAADGAAKINMGIGGALTAPVFNGRIDIAGGEIALRDPRVLVSDLNGTIALDGRRVVFDSLTGGLNGGILTLDGGFLLEGFSPAAGGLTAQIQRAAIDYPAGLQSEADALLTLRPGPAGWTLTGDIRVERSVYNETLSLPALIAARRSRPPSAPGSESWFDRVRLNLFAFTQQDLRVDNNYGRIEAGAALRVSGTGANPSLSGRVTLREGGEVYLAGNRFYVSRGSISFTSPNRILPEFDIELRTVISGRDLTLTLEGPLDRLETDVRSSDPTLDSREAMSLIFGNFQGEDAVALLSAELLGATGRAIGLDTLRVERGFDTDEFRADPGLVATDVDPSTRLTLSKRLRPDVELILSQSLRESGGLSAVVSYKPRRNIELRAVSRDNVDRSVALRHEITFGGAGGDTAAAAPPAEVSKVTISGDPGRPAEELMALLQLDAGDSFSFNAWQKDIDALRDEYHDRRYYEVRVRATRQVSEDQASVALDYRIEPGPIADLVLEGHPLEPAIERDIREAWMRTIFDRFLLEDIRTRIARHLLEEDYVGGSVNAEVTMATPERKQVRVTVAAGTRVSRRIVVYRGARAFSADRLDSVIQNAGLDIDGWLQPDRLAAALQTFYRGQGYLGAVVSATAPRIEGGNGVLDVTIEEGGRYRVAGLTLPGVSPERQADVAAAVRLDSGVPFVTDELDAAAARVEQYYAGRGFNAVQLEIATTPHPDAETVDVSVAVLEGLQQVVRDVATEGATRTREGVIRRALRLRVGEPVNLATWSQARKRMYDTNVFRQVDIEPVPMEPTTEDSAAGIQPVRAVVRVVEYPVWRLRYGLQFTDERDDFVDPIFGTSAGRTQSFGILTDLQNQNWMGRAITAGIAGRYDRRRQAASFFTANSSFYGLPIRSSGFVFASRQRIVLDTSETIEEKVGLTAEQRWRPFRTSEVIWSYRLERTRTSNPAAFDPNLPPGDAFIPFRTSRVNAAMVFDRRDDPSDPTRGWFSAANYEQAVEALGSDYGNIKLLAQQSVYGKLGGVVVAGRIQVGSQFGDEPLVTQDRFLLGGATTVRGYAENSIGPRDILNQPAGGDALLALNGELRFPVRGWVQGVAFVDGGNIFETRDLFSFRDIVVGYGLGLRLASPFAMLRVDFGIPAKTLTADRPANQFKSGRWYFGIGHIF
jgi:outer membrane protein assembly complex protein YaeT